LIRGEVRLIIINNSESALQNRLDGFLSAIPFDSIAADVAGTLHIEVSEVSSMLETYANESHISLNLIIPRLNKKLRLLEVGAGLCFTSLFLSSEGYRITALEPALSGFAMFEQLKNAILEHHSDLQLTVITEPAQQLDAARHGQFDLIFSNNVMEHIPDWQAALGAMTGVLSKQGVMRHACPNYSVPYEPHYGIPVFRHFPQLSRSLFLSQAQNTGIWDSLNFITSRNIRQYCNNHALSCCFEKELLYKALKRIDDDPLFKDRHQGLVATIASFVMHSGLGRIIRRIPPAMATPMIFEIRYQPDRHNAAQITTGFRAILSHPTIYNIAQRLVGAEKARSMLVRDYFPAMNGLRMLDIGCGTAEILRSLPEEMSYLGFDTSEAYIAEARRRFGRRATFRAEAVRQATLDDTESFDLILAFGLLHHLDDDEAKSLFQLAGAALGPGGRLITIDPVYAGGQSALARWMISKDRGQNVRTIQGYRQLTRKRFHQITTTVRHDMLHIPYSHLIMVCEKGDIQRA